MISANIHRYRVRLIIDRDPRCCWVVLPIRQDYDSPLLRLRHSRFATRGFQAREELAQDADGVLCARRQGSGDGWPACSRAERPRRIGRRGRDERVRDLQRWCVGCSKRYVSFALLCFALLLLSFPPQSLRIALHFSHTIGECARAEKSHTTPPSWTQGFSHCPRSRKSGQQHLPAHLSTLDSKTSKKSPGPKRCVRPAVGITSASHRNTARACVPLHPRQGLPLSGTALPSILSEPRENSLPDGVLHRSCQHAFYLRSHDIGATCPPQHLGVARMLCDFECKNSLQRDSSRVALACFCYCLNRF